MSQATKTELIEGKKFYKGSVTGRWQLSVKLNNNLPNKTDGFSTALISNYDDPFTGLLRVLLDGNKKPLLGFQLTTPTIILNPDKNAFHRNVVNFLLGHPEVGVDGVNLENEVITTKQGNPRYKLISLDNQENVKMDNEEVIDKVISRLIADGPKAIGIDKIRGILAVLDLNYINRRYYGNVSSEKKILVSTLKNFIRQSISNAKRVDEILNDIEFTKYILLVKEMIRFEKLKHTFNSYKYQGEPIGVDLPSVCKWFEDRPDEFNFISTEIKKLQDKEKEINIE
jgi:hypothetical protein